MPAWIVLLWAQRTNPAFLFLMARQLVEQGIAICRRTMQASVSHLSIRSRELPRMDRDERYNDAGATKDTAAQSNGKEA